MPEGKETEGDQKYSSIAHAKLKVVAGSHKAAGAIGEQLDETVRDGFRVGKVIVLLTCALTWPLATLATLGSGAVAFHFLNKRVKKDDGKLDRDLARMHELRREIKARQKSTDFVGAKGPAPHTSTG